MHGDPVQTSSSLDAFGKCAAYQSAKAWPELVMDQERSVLNLWYKVTACGCVCYCRHLAILRGDVGCFRNLTPPMWIESMNRATLWRSTVIRDTLRVLGYPHVQKHMVWEERHTLPVMPYHHHPAPPPNVACAKMRFDLYTVCIPVTVFCSYLPRVTLLWLLWLSAHRRKEEGSLRSLSRLRLCMGKRGNRCAYVHFEIRQEQIYLFYGRAQSGRCLLILRLLSTSQCGRNMCFSAWKCAREQRGILHTRIIPDKRHMASAFRGGGILVP